MIDYADEGTLAGQYVFNLREHVLKHTSKRDTWYRLHAPIWYDTQLEQNQE